MTVELGGIETSAYGQVKVEQRKPSDCAHRNTMYTTTLTDFGPVSKPNIHILHGPSVLLFSTNLEEVLCESCTRSYNSIYTGIKDNKLLLQSVIRITGLESNKALKM